jgi:hypothetical protein
MQLTADFFQQTSKVFTVSELTRSILGTLDCSGERARPRVHFSAPSPKSHARTTYVNFAVFEKVRDGEGAIASTRGACAPQTYQNARCS